MNDSFYRCISMQEMIVIPDEQGQRLDKFLKRRLPLAPASFLYKMLRKKNITLKGKKADGSEKVQEGDVISLFLSDETIRKFSAPGPDEGGSEKSPEAASGLKTASGSKTASGLKTVSGLKTASGSIINKEKEEIRAYRRITPLLGRDPVLYEDENILIVKKVPGILSQKAEASDLSMNEWLRGYLRISKKESEPLVGIKTGPVGIKPESGGKKNGPVGIRPESGEKKTETGRIKPESGGKKNGPVGIKAESGRDKPSPASIETAAGFEASVCNRLDRNTGGILLCAKSLQGSRALSALIRERRIGKTYRMLVHGRVLEGGTVQGELIKDTRKNHVAAAGGRPEKDAAPRTGNLSKADGRSRSQGIRVRQACTLYRPVKTGSAVSLVEADLITGRSHQLRVHMASIGHPILFDPRYGNRQLDLAVKEAGKTSASGREKQPAREKLPGKEKMPGREKTAGRDKMPEKKNLPDTGQLLWCTKITFPEGDDCEEMRSVLAPLAGKSFFSPFPEWWMDFFS